MPKIIRNHPYVIAFLFVFLLLFFIGIFALDTSWSESLFGAAVLSAVGVGGIWWKQEGFG
ncbi:MAG: hypothetical protein HY865_08580 [Chloroflexi bacterium]|nr:hypothetical protein [Chloroflexota bacterium]